MSLLTFNLIRLLVLFTLTTSFSLFWAPYLIKILRKKEFWKKKEQLKTITNTEATILNSLRKERKTFIPRSGGILIWFSVLLTVLIALLLSKNTSIWWFEKINFLSRNETWLPLFDSWFFNWIY